MRELLYEIYNMSRPVSKEEERLSKYTFAAYNFGFDYRMIHIGDLLKQQGFLSKGEIPKYFYEFIAPEGRALLIPNFVQGDIMYMQLRSLNTRRFTMFGMHRTLPYGIGDIDVHFKYGDRIILTEGPLDRDMLTLISPNVFAILSSGISKMQLELISLLTNNVYILYDKDETGEKSSRIDKKKLKKKGVEVKVLENPEGVEDPGELAYLKFIGQDFDFDVVRSQYFSMLNTESSDRGGIYN